MREAHRRGERDDRVPFDEPGAAIDFAQQEVRRLNDGGVTAEYVDPPDDLVGTG